MDTQREKRNIIVEMAVDLLFSLDEIYTPGECFDAKEILHDKLVYFLIMDRSDRELKDGALLRKFDEIDAKFAGEKIHVY